MTKESAYYLDTSDGCRVEIFKAGKPSRPFAEFPAYATLDQAKAAAVDRIKSHMDELTEELAKLAKLTEQDIFSTSET